ncbi:hypothetical protein ACLB1G_05030 [Oxalobacteraceae bacterium A2-2]
MDFVPLDFRRAMLSQGIISYQEQETLWDIGKRCAGTIGMSTGAGVGLVTMNVGGVTIPGIGVVPGAIAGFLAGMVGGTAACTMANLSYRNELRRLLDQ